MTGYGKDIRRLLEGEQLAVFEGLVQNPGMSVVEVVTGLGLENWVPPKAKQRKRYRRAAA